MSITLLTLIVAVNSAGLQFDHSSTVEVSDNFSRFFGHTNSLTSSQFTSVVRVTTNQDPNDSFESDLSIKIGGNQLQCKRATTNNLHQVQHHRIRSQMAALQGYVFDWYGDEDVRIHFFPNEKVEMFQQGKLVGEFVLTDDGIGDELVFTSSEESFSFPRIVAKCQHRPLERSVGGKICRIGDQIGTSTDRIASFQETRKTLTVHAFDGTRTSKSWAETECVSDGSWDQKIDGDFILRLENVKEEDGFFSLTLSSPLCENSGDVPWMSVLSPLCFVGQFNSRHFEFCPGIARAGVVQLGGQTPRTAIGHFEPPKSFEIRNRRLFVPSASTDLNCMKNLPVLSEGYNVRVAGVGSVSIAGVGGSFNPITYDSPSGVIRGVAVYDSNNPFGCDSSSSPPSEVKTSGKDWIAIVDRGSCMFQEKGLNMQRKGAKAVIVVNSAKGGMIAALASVVGKPPLNIPVILVDRDGSVLKSTFAGRQLIVRSLPIDGQALPKLTDTVSVKSEWYCDPRWAEGPESKYAKPCVQGDQVLVYREGEDMGHQAEIVEKLGGGIFLVRLQDTGATEEVSGWQIYKDSHSPCTAELGTFITEVVRSDTCELTVRLHSSILCGDKRMREPKSISKDIECGIQVS